MRNGFNWIRNIQKCVQKDRSAGVDPENFLRGGGGFQIPRRGLTENFNMAKINNLAIPGGGGGGSGPPVPPLWIRPWKWFSK